MRRFIYGGMLLAAVVSMLLLLAPLGIGLFLQTHFQQNWQRPVSTPGGALGRGQYVQGAYHSAAAWIWQPVEQGRGHYVMQVDLIHGPFYLGALNYGVTPMLLAAANGVVLQRLVGEQAGMDDRHLANVRLYQEFNGRLTGLIDFIDDGKTAPALSGLGDFYWQPRSQRLTATGEWQRVRIDNIDMRDASLALDYYMQPSPAGTMEMRAKQFQQIWDDGKKLQLSDAELSVVTVEKQARMQTDISVRWKKLLWDDSEYQDGKVDLQWLGLTATQQRQLVKYLMRWSDNTEALPEALTILLPTSAQIELKKIQLQNDAGVLEGWVRITMPSTPIENYTFAALIEKIHVQGEISISIELAEQLYIRRAEDLLAEQLVEQTALEKTATLPRVTTPTKSKIEAKNKKPIDPKEYAAIQITQLIDRHVLELKGDRYHANFDWVRGRLQINGEPIEWRDLWYPAADTAAEPASAEAAVSVPSTPLSISVSTPVSTPVSTQVSVPVSIPAQKSKTP
ncbi:MAG: DUF945 family protein [Gammaproteobacteria bacterium]|nr:DUF945 family protein [Gammaproteobacteria bacterium]